MLVGSNINPILLEGATVARVKQDGKRVYIDLVLGDGTVQTVMVWCGDSIFENHSDKHVHFTKVVF